MLQTALKKGVLKHQEGRVLGRWRACSQMEKGMFLKWVGQWGEASVAVRFCDIGWLNVSVECCVFCSSVFSVRKRTFLRHAGEFFLSQSAQSSRRFLAHISSPWGGGPSPNPSPAGRGVICEVTPIRLLTYFVKVFSLTERTEFTEPFGAQFRAHRRPSAYRVHRGLSTKIGCNVLCNRLT